MIWLDFLRKLDPRRSPLTDPRSLSLALLVHLVLFTIASVIVLQQSKPADTEIEQPIRGDLGPVDNRSRSDETAGGSPGDVNGSAKIQAYANDRDDHADPASELIGEAFKSPLTRSNASADAKPSAVDELGLIGGSGRYGGDGSGGGSGSGRGPGSGPGTAFFGVKEHAKSYAYVIDRSGSMAVNDALGIAKRELLASLRQLGDESTFGIVFYNHDPTTLPDAEGRMALTRATEEEKERVRALLAKIPADGATDHMEALRAGLAFGAEALFFLTDGDLMAHKDVEAIVKEAGKTRIHVIEFGIGPDPGGTTPLRRLGAMTGGSYRYIEVSSFKSF